MNYINSQTQLDYMMSPTEKLRTKGQHNTPHLKLNQDSGTGIQVSNEGASTHFTRRSQSVARHFSVGMRTPMVTPLGGMFSPKVNKRENL